MAKTSTPAFCALFLLAYISVCAAKTLWRGYDVNKDIATIRYPTQPEKWRQRIDRSLGPWKDAALLAKRGIPENSVVHLNKLYGPAQENQEENCCSYGYRSQWLSWGLRRDMRVYCSRDLPCCDDLVSEDVTFWGGFGYTFCMQVKKIKKIEVPKLNNWPDYFRYYTHGFHNQRRTRSSYV